MGYEEFRQTLAQDAPPPGLPPVLEALWWDARGDWTRAHGLVDELETRDAMVVHAYLHRKEGQEWNADYWYQRAGTQFRRTRLEDEWRALVQALLPDRPGLRSDRQIKG